MLYSVERQSEQNKYKIYLSNILNATIFQGFHKFIPNERSRLSESGFCRQNQKKMLVAIDNLAIDTDLFII